MRARLAAFALSSFLLLGPTGALADEAPDAAKLADIRKLLQLTGAGSLGRQVIEQMIGNFRGAFPNVPDTFWTDFLKEAKTEELVDKVALIYDKYLSHDEVKDIIRFYQTPSGKKLVSVLPQVTQESMVVGQDWGRALGEQIAARLKQRQGDGSDGSKPAKATGSRKKN